MLHPEGVGERKGERGVAFAGGFRERHDTRTNLRERRMRVHGKNHGGG